MVKNWAQVGLTVSIDYFCLCYLLDIQTTANYCAVWKAFGQQQKISKILSNFNILRSHYLRYYIQIAHCIYFSRWSNIKWQVCFNFSSMESHVLALELCWQLRGLIGERERKKKAGEIQLLCPWRTVIVVKKHLKMPLKAKFMDLSKNEASGND